MKHFLFSDEGKAYLAQEYEQNDRSTYDIAKEQNTYANMVRRAILHHGMQLKTKADAQKAALSSGRTTHPTKDRKRTEAEKISIGSAVAESWKGISEEEKERRAEISRQQWQAMSAEERADLQKKAGQGLRKAAVEGSQLEKYLIVGIKAAGHEARFHADFIISAENMHVDILLRKKNIAIEIDGPSHFTPIWGEDALAKTIAADNKKTGLLLQAGYTVIRVKCLVKTLSRYQKAKALDDVLKAIETAKGGLIELEVKRDE